MRFASALLLAIILLGGCARLTDNDWEAPDSRSLAGELASKLADVLDSLEPEGDSSPSLRWDGFVLTDVKTIPRQMLYEDFPPELLKLSKLRLIVMRTPDQVSSESEPMPEPGMDIAQSGADYILRGRLIAVPDHKLLICRAELQLLDGSGENVLRTITATRSKPKRVRQDPDRY